MNQRTEKPTEIQTLIKLGLFTKKNLKNTKTKRNETQKITGLGF